MWFLVQLVPIVRTTILHQLASATTAQLVNIVKSGPPSLQATVIKDTSVLEANQLQLQRAFSILAHTRTVCLESVLLVTIVQWELHILFRVLQVTSKTNLEATFVNLALRVCTVPLQDYQMLQELALLDSSVSVLQFMKSLTIIKLEESAHLVISALVV